MTATQSEAARLLTPGRREIALDVAAVGVPVALLHAAALAGGVYFQRDVQLMWLAGRTAVTAALSEGSWPFWNPLVGFGEPLLANANHQLAYPLAWPGLLLSPGRAYVLGVVGHLLLLGLGVVRAGRVMGLSPWASRLAGALSVASGPVVSLTTLWNQLSGTAWVPWAAVAACRASSGSPRGVAATAVAIAMPVLAGSPEAAIAAGALSLVIAGRRGLRALVPWTCAVALAVLLSAIQWLPSMLAARQSWRAHMPAAMRLDQSVHPATLPALALPLALAEQPLLPADRRRLLDGWDPFLASPYLGAAALVLAAYGAATRPRAPVLLTGTAVAVLAALGRHGPLAPLAELPVLSMLRYPAKALVLASLAMPLLAARGFERWRTHGPGRAGLLGLLPLALALASVPWILPLPPSGLLATAWPALAAGTATAALLARGRPGSAPVAALLCVLATFDLVAAHARTSVTAPPALFRARPPLLDAAGPPDTVRLYTWDYFVAGAAERHLGRAVPYQLARGPVGWPVAAAQALGLRRALYPPSAALQGYSGSFDLDVPGLSPRPVEELRGLLLRMEGTAAHERLLRIGAVTHVAALHDVPGLRRVASDPGLFELPVLLFRVGSPLDRTRVVGGVRPSTAVEDLLDPGWDPETTILLERAAPRPPPASFAGHVRVRRSFAEILVHVEASAAGHVVSAEAWDPGWSATVDGTSAPVRRANHAFLAVPVEAGSHEVRLRYRPPGLRAGLVLSTTAALTLLGLAVRRRPVKA